MKTFFTAPLRGTLLLLALLCAALPAESRELVIMHTNDTHSQIEPGSRDLGGVVRRKVLIDSIRAEHPDALLVDAGDMVQGTLYFTLFGGEVEARVMNALGYDMQILGNHEFDNGLDSLASVYALLDAERLSTNYDVRGTRLEGLLKPYTIRQAGPFRVGFIGINLDPAGMISDANYRGLRYLDPVKAANAMAWYLKNIEGVDRVVALTHIGYTADTGVTDPELVTSTEGIDLVIGGHSHTLLNRDAPVRVPNAAGDSILITQTGSRGQWLGVATLDLETGHATEQLIPVDSRLDARAAGEQTAPLRAMLATYAHGVDSLMNVRIGSTAAPFTTEEPGLLNLAADMVLDLGAGVAGRRPDLSIVNAGGVRSPWSKGKLTKGQVINSFPFDNRVVLLEITGRDLAEAFDVMASRGGDGVSSNVKATFDPATGRCLSITISGKPLDPDATYLLSTIDYLAGGGDYMSSLRRGRKIGSSERVLYNDFIDYIQSGPLKGRTLRPDNTPRMVPINQN